jgi:hypothetical protein
MSSEEFAASQIVDGRHHPFQMTPPDPWAQVVGRLPYRRDELPENGEPIVVLERGESVAGDTLFDQRGVIPEGSTATSLTCPA